MRKQFTDGVEHDELEEQDEHLAPAGKHKTRANECFNIEKVLAEAALSELRSNNLMRFLEHVLQQVLVKNLDPTSRQSLLHECTGFFSNELLLMTMKARELLLEKAD